MSSMRWTNRQWLKLIDEWMGLHGRATLNWKDVIGLEGGYGREKIKSVADALKPENAGTWPGIWFQSGQKDYSVYQRHDYVYSLLFGRGISHGSIDIVGRTLRDASPVHPVDLMDWGGTVFTAMDLLTLLPTGSQIYMVNVKSPQMVFAEWIIDKFHLEESIHVLDEDSSIVTDGGDEFNGTILLSETLEHIREPLYYLHVKLLRQVGDVELFIANSFCTPAYGHHVPIIMRGKECATVRQANKEFREGMEGFGFAGEKMMGWNSRMWRWTK
jgi:hypothetical protein